MNKQSSELLFWRTFKLACVQIPNRHMLNNFLIHWNTKHAKLVDGPCLIHYLKSKLKIFVILQALTVSETHKTL